LLSGEPRKVNTKLQDLLIMPVVSVELEAWEALEELLEVSLAPDKC
jgi:hypothetical protein